MKKSEIKKTTNNGIVARIIQEVKTPHGTIEEQLIAIEFNFKSEKAAEKWIAKRI